MLPWTFLFKKTFHFGLCYDVIFLDPNPQFPHSSFYLWASFLLPSCFFSCLHTSFPCSLALNPAHFFLIAPLLPSEPSSSLAPNPAHYPALPFTPPFLLGLSAHPLVAFPFPLCLLHHPSACFFLTAPLLLLEPSHWRLIPLIIPPSHSYCPSVIPSSLNNFPLHCSTTLPFWVIPLPLVAPFTSYCTQYYYRLSFPSALTGT